MPNGFTLYLSNYTISGLFMLYLFTINDLVIKILYL